METSASWFQRSKCGLTLQPLVRGVCVVEEVGKKFRAGLCILKPFLYYLLCLLAFVVISSASSQCSCICPQN